MKEMKLDIAELDGGKVATVTFPNVNNLTEFHVRVIADTGLWMNAAYDFTFKIPAVRSKGFFNMSMNMKYCRCTRMNLLKYSVKQR